MASQGAGDPDVFVDAVDELRRALPDEEEEDDEFHDALESGPSKGSDALKVEAEASKEAAADSEEKTAVEPSKETYEELEKLEAESEKSEAELEAERRRRRQEEEEAEARRLEERQQEEAELPEAELESRFEAAQRLKAEGNEEFRGAQFDAAIERYAGALELCPLRHKKERAIMFANRAACLVKKEQWEPALSDCSASLALHPSYLKCLIRRAEVHERLDKLDEALADYQAVLELDPGNGPARMKCLVLPDKIKERNEKMKEEMLGQLKNLGNMILKPFGLSTNNFQMVQDPATGGYSINFKQ